MCPKCRVQIPLEDVNVAQDIALCRRCQKTYSFAALNLQANMPAVDTSQPPRGMWYHNQGNEFEVGASTRSWAALFLVPFTLFWSGMSLGGIYGTQIYKGHFQWSESLFGIPFLLGTLVLVPITLMTLFGKLRVRGVGDQGSVFMGIGPLGWNRTFQWSEIRAVRLSLTRYQQNGRNLPLIELEGPKSIRFGSQLSETRRDFILAVLQRQVRAV
jgi:hypothetical protein